MEKVRITIAFIGRALITIGLLMLLFVSYQLWGTNIWEARAQDSLKTEFNKTLKNTRAVRTQSGKLPEIKRTPPGDALAIIEIPKIGVDRIVVSGTAKEDLKKGPGHYLNTPLPGELGNTAIAGHRTTYGAPFYRLDELAVGDEIIITTSQGEFTYKVSEKPFPVSPNQVEIINPTMGPDGKIKPTLTLTTCHPRFSAKQRLVIKADLQLEKGQKLVEAPKSINKEQKLLDEEEGTFFDGVARQKSPLMLWGAFLLLIGCGWWFLFHRYHSLISWFGGVIVFLPILFVFYIYLEKALPSNY